MGGGGALLRQPGILELVLLIVMDELNTSMPQFLCFLLPLGMQEGWEVLILQVLMTNTGHRLGSQLSQLRDQQLVQPLKKPIQIYGLEACVPDMLLQSGEGAKGRGRRKM